MPPGLPARRRAVVLMIVAGCYATGSQAFAASMLRPAASSIVPGSRATKVAKVPHITFRKRTFATPADTSDVHGTLRRAINDFMDAWRKDWKDLEWARHGQLVWLRAMNASDPSVGETRRYWALHCYFITPEIIPNAKRNWRPYSSVEVARYPVVVSPDFGATCPLYYPPNDEPVADESRSIDMALSFVKRIEFRKRREVLIDRLSKALSQYPDDDWIAGQLTRFTYDQQDPVRTVAAAARCISGSGFCAALNGLAFEQSGKFVAAESAFHKADELAHAASNKSSKENSDNCTSTETRMLLSIVDNTRLKNESCDKQQLLVQQMWWLADPLWSVAGNERYVAHGSRTIHTKLRAVTERDERYIWAKIAGGESLRETVIRYGWPNYTFYVGWQMENVIRRMGPNPGTTRPAYEPITTKEYSPSHVRLIPSFDAVMDPYSAGESLWELYQSPSDVASGKSVDYWWPIEHFQSNFHIASLPGGQDLQWRRDSTITYQLAIDDPLRNLDSSATQASAAFLMGGTSAATTHELARTAVAAGTTLRFLTSISSRPLVMSAEVWPRTANEQAMRTRFGLRPPQSLREMKSNEYALSAPVFMRLPNRDMHPPTDEANVLRYMAGDLAFPAKEILGLYWESYGFIPGDTLQFELKFKRADDVNVARKIGAFFGVASALRDSVSIRWSEPDGRHAATLLSTVKPAVGRSIAIDLGALTPGTYDVSIEVRKNATTSARSERRFVVLKP